jgi:hypothetical protein
MVAYLNSKHSLAAVSVVEKLLRMGRYSIRLDGFGGPNGRTKDLMFRGELGTAYICIGTVKTGAMLPFQPSGGSLMRA